MKCVISFAHNLNFWLERCKWFDGNFVPFILEYILVAIKSNFYSVVFLSTARLQKVNCPKSHKSFAAEGRKNSICNYQGIDRWMQEKIFHDYFAVVCTISVSVLATSIYECSNSLPKNIFLFFFLFVCRKGNVSQKEVSKLRDLYWTCSIYHHSLQSSL